MKVGRVCVHLKLSSALCDKKLRLTTYNIAINRKEFKFKPTNCVTLSLWFCKLKIDFIPISGTGVTELKFY